jgi:hypothetical protein
MRIILRLDVGGGAGSAADPGTPPRPPVAGHPQLGLLCPAPTFQGKQVCTLTNHLKGTLARDFRHSFFSSKAPSPLVPTLDYFRI